MASLPSRENHSRSGQPIRNLMEQVPPIQYHPRPQGSGRSYPLHAVNRPTSSSQRTTSMPMYLWMTALVMGLAGAGMVFSGAFQADPVRTLISAERDLRKGPALPKLNAEGPVVPTLPKMPAAPPVVVDIPLIELPGSLVEAPLPRPEVVIPPPALALEGSVLTVQRLDLPAVEAPQAIAFLEPAPTYTPIPAAPLNAPAPSRADPDWNPPFLAREYRGDTPMRRNWKTLAFLAATIVYVHQPVVMAQNTENPDLTKIQLQLSQIQKSLDDLKGVPADIAAIKKDITTLFGDVFAQKIDIGKANQRLDQLESLVKLLQAKGPVASGVDNAQFEDLRDQIKSLESAIAKLQNRPVDARVALSPPTNIARVVLVNLYNEELLFVINNRNQRVAPNTTVTLENVPSGLLNYEVISQTWGLTQRKTTNLQNNETFTLTAR